jgi:hypothetical protein
MLRGRTTGGREAGVQRARSSGSHMSVPIFYSERECMCVEFESNGENRYDGLRVQTSHENIK